MVPSKKRTIALFLGAYVCLVMGEALCFIICTMQPNYRASLLNSNSNCLTGFLIVVTWQTLIIALLSWTPRHWWLPISKLNLILWTFFLPLTVTIMAAPAAITIFPMCMEALKNQAHFNVPANRFYR